MDAFLLRMKRAETPFYKAIKRFAFAITSPHVRQFPQLLQPLFRLLFQAHFGIVVLWHSFWNIIYYHPLFQGRCASIGTNVSVDRLPFITGPVEIHIGDNVWIGGHVQIASGWGYGTPQLILHDHVQLNWHTRITVNKEVIIEEYVRISWNCTISDSDGHPREADLRATNAPLRSRDIRPIRICKHAWIGNSSHILKGVTIGEGAVVAANSVVISDVPAYSLVMGNPAEVIIRNYGRPTSAVALNNDYSYPG